MLLLIDAGNTRVKWSLHDPLKLQSKDQRLGTWLHSDSMTHAEFAEQGAPWADYPITRIIASNVAGTAIQSQLAMALAAHQIEIEWFASRANLAGVTNRYLKPEQLGSDRFATAIAVHALFPGQDLIVATCGTATTIDAVSAHGEFIGGMIAPGLLLMAQSLAQNTAQLPQVKEATVRTAQFADHTQAAIISGCLAAQAGAIDYAARKFSALTDADAPTLPLCILSGGAANYIAPSLKLPHQIVDNLVLIGLQVYASC